MAFGKETDSRKTGFIERFGELVQVELDALPPDVLRGLFQDQIDALWNWTAYQQVIGREEDERLVLEVMPAMIETVEEARDDMRAGRVDQPDEEDR